MSILQTIDLKKYYGTEPNITRALNGVNFTVEQGEFVAVVGTSGSGKSTLLHMMGGLDTPTSGSVIVRGEELAKKNDDELTIFRLIIPELSEPPVRTLGATIPENESHIFR